MTGPQTDPAPDATRVVLRRLTAEELEMLEGDASPPGLLLTPDYRMSWWISPQLRGVKDPQNYAPFVVLRASDGFVIGRLSLEPQLDPPVIAFVEICDRLQGQGFGRAAICAALDLLKARPEVRRVRAVIFNDNIRSQRAFSACGFQATTEQDGQLWEWRR